MKPIEAFAFLVLALPSLAQQPAAQKATSRSAQKTPLLSSQIGGRDMMFITQTMDQLKTLELLALHASVATNNELRDLGRQITRSVAQQSTLLSTLAEMRNIPENPRESLLRKDYIERLADNNEKSMDATLTELLLATDRELFAAMKNAENSKDAAVREFISNFLPELGGQLRTTASLHAAMHPPAVNISTASQPLAEGSAKTPPAIPAKPAKPLPKVKLREF